MRTARPSGRPAGGLHQVPFKSRPPREQAPLPVDRITDACKSITLPQLCCGRYLSIKIHE